MVRPAARFLIFFFTAAGLAAIALWVWSRAETPFAYMVVGAFGATALLAAAFVFLVRKKLL
jgi:hypothetical protein